MKDREILPIKIVLGVVIAIVSFSLSKKVTDSFDILLTNQWATLINLFLYPAYILIFIFFMAIFFFFAYNIMNYIFIKTDLIEEKKFNLTQYPFLKKITNNKSLVGVLGNTFYKTLLILIATISLFSSFFSSVGSSLNKNYEKSFYTNSYTTDYNDSQIIFYNSELEEASKSFVNAGNDYDVFKAFTKKEMSLECINRALNKYDESTAYKLLIAFKKNARNKYAHSKSMIKQHRENERILEKNIQYTISKITEPARYFLDKTMPNRCKEKVPAQQMYKSFLPEYINNTKHTLLTYQKPLEMQKSTNYMRKRIKHLEDWLEIVRNRQIGEL